MTKKELYRCAEDAVGPLKELQRYVWNYSISESGIVKPGPQGPYREICALRKLALVNRARQILGFEPLKVLDQSKEWEPQIYTNENTN